MLAFAETSTIDNAPANAASTTSAITHQERPKERRVSDDRGGGVVVVVGSGAVRVRVRVGVAAGVGERIAGGGGIGGSRGARSGENVAMS
jgi:hypothetical protein